MTSLRTKHRVYNKGFVALTSVVIISAILLLVATSLSLSGFYGRFNILESEFCREPEYRGAKMRSRDGLRRRV